MKLNLPGFTELNDVTFGAGNFVAVGDAGLILTSVDGVNWTRENSSTFSNLNDVAYGDGAFIIVGESGTILKSNDDRRFFDVILTSP